MEAFSFYVDPASKALALSLTILLARHGTHDDIGRVLSGRSEIALNGSGRDQAHKLAARLASITLENVYTSPRRRAKETAQIVAHAQGLEPITVDAYDEIDFGDWAGRGFADLKDDGRWCHWNVARGHASTPAGDTMESVTRRALGHLEACKDVGMILCVSHCDVIRGLVAHYLGLHSDGLLSFDIDPASITTIEFQTDSARVVAVNERVS